MSKHKASTAAIVVCTTVLLGSIATGAVLVAHYHGLGRGVIAAFLFFFLFMLLVVGVSPDPLPDDRTNRTKGR